MNSATAITVYTRGRYITAVILLCSLATGCDMPGQPKPDDRPIPANAVLNFEVLYQANCAGCHGANGNYGPAPPLNDPLFLQIVPDEVLADVIRHGRPGTPMAAFGAVHGGTLTLDQVNVLAAGLKPRWLKHDKSESVAIEPPPYLAPDEQTSTRRSEPSSSGAAVFAQACAGCHGDNGEGGTVGAVHDVSFLALISDQALRRLVITGRPDLGMPTFAGDDGRGDFKPLTADQVSAVVALLAEWRATGPCSSPQASVASEVQGGEER